MSPLQEDGPPENVGARTPNGSISSNKKRPHLSEKSHQPSTKRTKVAKNVAELAPGRRRVFSTKTRGPGFGRSTKPIWSVVAGPPSSRKALGKPQPIVRPRLWSSSRGELGSTFTEISVSKCTNNLSWTSTDMPILILDDESISLDNPEVDDGLCMDVTFIRQFVCGSSDARPQQSEILSNNMSVKQEDVSCVSVSVGDPPPCTLVQPTRLPSPQECQEQSQTAQALSEEQPSPIPLNTPIPALPENLPFPENSKSVIMEDLPPILVTTKTSNLKSRKTQQKRRVSQPSRKPTQQRKATGTLSSLRFKRFKSITDGASDPGATEDSCQSPSTTQTPPPILKLSQPSSTGDSHLISVNPSQLMKHERTDPLGLLPSQAPEISMSHSPQFPITPLPNTIPNSPPLPRFSSPASDTGARPNVGVKDQIDSGPPPLYYPDNRFLPQLNNFPQSAFPKLNISPTSFTQGQPGYSSRKGVPGSRGGLANAEPSATMSCRCSRFRYDPQCPACGSGDQKHMPPLESKSVQRCKQVNLGTERGQFFGVSVALRSMRSNSPNNNPLLNPTARGTARAQSVTGNVVPAQRLIGPCSPPDDWTKLSTDQVKNDVNGGARFPTSLAPPPSEPVAIRNTVFEASNGRNAAMLPPRVPNPPRINYMVLQGPGSTGEPPLPTGLIPPFKSAPSQAPNALVANGCANKPIPTTDPIFPPPIDDEVVPAIHTVTSPALKRKGKERCQKVESSGDAPLSMQIRHKHTAKKAKFQHERATNRNHTPPMQVHRPSMTIACSSKTRLEDLPASVLDGGVPAKNGATTVDLDGPKAKPSPEVLVAPVPTKFTKRRGRPAKNPKVAPCAPCLQPPSEELPKQADSSPPHSAPQAPAQLPPVLSISAAEPKSRVSKPKLEKLQPISVGTIPRRENGVPVVIPDEIRALVDAYITGTPIGIFAARRHVKSFWGLELPSGEEIGYAFMGFYRLSRVWEGLIEEGEVDDVKEERVKKTKGKQLAEGMIKLQVRWKFRMRWEPGGEDWQTRERDKLTSPWWDPVLKAQRLSVLPQPDLEDSDDESTIAYRTGRRKNPNFARRHCFFNQTFFSVLPLHLLAPALTEIPDSAFPRGWHCEDCGKLNFRYHLRHRQCSSSYCKDKPQIGGYAIDIDRIRDPQDALPLSLPLNELPGNLSCETKVQVWKDRTKTLVYRLKMTDARSTVVRHIFTCNLRDLQTEASDLLNAIQKDVPLRRVLAEADPYFTYYAGDGDRDGESGKFVSWGSAPECLQRAQELMNNRGVKYSREATELNIRQLTVQAWVTAGNKRAPDLLFAKQRCIVIMCLGCEVIMSISPKSVIASNGDQALISDLDKLTPMEDFDPQDVKLDNALSATFVGGAEVGAKTAPTDTDNQVLSPLAASTKVGTETKKTEKTVLSFSLIHGDMLLLEGDNFEYAIKRTGTSILLFGS